MMLLKSLTIVCFLVSLPAVAGEAQKPVQTTQDRKAPEYVRCKKILETGSMVKHYKICKTNAEWKSITSNNNRTAREVLETTSSKGESTGP
jgi:hypothetical protein